MGRLLLLILVIAVIVLLWMAFKPSTWKSRAGKNAATQAPRQVKGPDDDEDFLWTIEKKRFKQRRAEEQALKEEEERLKRARERYATPEKPAESESEKPEDKKPQDKPEDPAS
ncbi:hypothetical protein SFC07_03370 [Corynebacterium callunae]|uniref:hypothetical protein n=1 Tax=Corynebacterium callunae TaxID=1721 RepID=UPI0039827853